MSSGEQPEACEICGFSTTYLMRVRSIPHGWICETCGAVIMANPVFTRDQILMIHLINTLQEMKMDKD